MGGGIVLLTQSSGVVIYAARNSDHFCQLKSQVSTTIHNLQRRGRGGDRLMVSQGRVCVCVCVCVRVWVSSFQVLNEWTDFYETSYERYFSGENQNTTSVELKIVIMM